MKNLGNYRAFYLFVPTMIVFCGCASSARCQAQSVSVKVTTYGQTYNQPAPICNRQPLAQVQVTTQSLEWYQTAVVVDRPCVSVVITPVITQSVTWCQSAPTYAWQQPVPVVIVQQPEPVVQYYTQPIVTVPILESGPVYYSSYGYYPRYYPSYTYGYYPNVYTERAHIDETWRMYGFGERHHSHNSFVPSAPQYFPPVRQLPQPRAGVPFPSYQSPSYGHGHGPSYNHPQQGPQQGPSYQPPRQQSQQQRSGPSQGGGHRGGHR